MYALPDLLVREATVEGYEPADGDLTEMFWRPKPSDDELSSKELAATALTLLNRATDVMERLNKVLDQAEPTSERGDRD